MRVTRAKQVSPTPLGGGATAPMERGGQARPLVVVVRCEHLVGRRPCCWNAWRSSGLSVPAGRLLLLLRCSRLDDASAAHQTGSLVDGADTVALLLAAGVNLLTVELTGSSVASECCHGRGRGAAVAASVGVTRGVRCAIDLCWSPDSRSVGALRQRRGALARGPGFSSSSGAAPQLSALCTDASRARRGLFSRRPVCREAARAP